MLKSESSSSSFSLLCAFVAPTHPCVCVCGCVREDDEHTHARSGKVEGEKERDGTAKGRKERGREGDFTGASLRSVL